MEAWQAAFIESLEQASDIERQRRAWTAHSHDVPDPTELMCQIFDDSAVGDFLEEGPVFSEAADASLRRLSSLADRVDLHLPPDALLASEVWIEFAREAGRALTLVRTALGEQQR